MPVNLTINGVTFAYPERFDENWGDDATDWATAVTSGMLQKAGGSFHLTDDVDFGNANGLLVAYVSSRNANHAESGIFRLANGEVICWRNNADSADIELEVSSGDILFFAGEEVLTGTISNTQVAADAAIAFSKMAALTASRAVVTDGSGVIAASAATAVEVGYLSGVSSAIQTQITARLQLAGGTMTGDLFLNADPTASNQAATKLYVDNASAGNVNNFTVRVASTAAVNLTNELENGDTLDGVVLATGNLVLVKNQASTAANGIYVVPAAGAASRDTSMDNWTEVVGATVFVTAGTANAGTQWKFNTAAGGTIGVTAIPIVQYNASQVYTASGEGIELSGSQFALELDGTTLSKSGSGLKVNEIANAQIAAAAAIAVNKLAALTASRAVVTDGSGFAAAATTTATEIGYVNGVTSAIQTQLDARIAAATLTTNGDILTRTAGSPARVGIGTTGQVLAVVAGAPAWASAATLSTGEFFADTGNGHGSSATRIRLITTTRQAVTWGTWAASGTLGSSMTVSEKGIYLVNYTDIGDTNYFGITVNVSSTTTNVQSLSYATGRRAMVRGADIASGQNITATWCGILQISDVVRPQTNGSVSSTSDAVMFNMCQILKLP